MKTTELRRLQNKLTKNQSKLLLAKERVQEKIDDMTELGNEIIAHKERLKEIENEIDALKASAAAGGGTPTTPLEYKRLAREETNTIDDITEKEKKLNGVLATELVNEENEVIRYEAAVQKVQKKIEDYKTGAIAAKEKEIEDANLLVIQAQQN